MSRFHSLKFGAILIFALNVPAHPIPITPGSPDKSEQDQHRAQDDAPTADEQLKGLTIKLDLTADQQARIKPILQGLHDATLKVEQDQSLSREERLAKVRPDRYKARDQIREVLNDDQKKKFEQYMQGPHSEMHGNLTGATSSPEPPQN
jgi:hypothetical protein